MIKITKDLNQIPISLLPAFTDLFPDRVGANLVPIPLKSRTTHTRRMEVINAGAYTDNGNFNSRYKEDDIRMALLDIYKSKCAFCEQKVEQYHIEHYRPKDVYYWLAFSWDNLLMSCPTCNEHKGKIFSISGIQATFTNTEVNVRRINISSAEYDTQETPILVNPEKDDPLGEIRFQKNGTIESDNHRFTHTINQCQINRSPLKDSRREILDRFKEHITSALAEYQNINDQNIAIGTIVRNFVIDSKKDTLEFLAFRRYAISQKWVNDITKSHN